MTGRGPSVSETSYALLRERLHGVLVDAVQARPGAAGGIGSVPCLASATLYALLMAHPVDRRGRCRSCAGPGWLGRRRQVCLVFQKAHFWLRQPTPVVRAHLADEVGVDVPGPRGSADPEATDVIPRIEPDPTDPRTAPLQTPAVPSPLPPRRFPWAGRPDLDHGWVGEHPERPRPSRGPSDNPGPGPVPLCSFTGGMTWPG